VQVISRAGARIFFELNLPDVALSLSGSAATFSQVLGLQAESVPGDQ